MTILGEIFSADDKTIHLFKVPPKVPPVFMVIWGY